GSSVASPHQAVPAPTFGNVLVCGDASAESSRHPDTRTVFLPLHHEMEEKAGERRRVFYHSALRGPRDEKSPIFTGSNSPRPNPLPAGRGERERFPFDARVQIQLESCTGCFRLPAPQKRAILVRMYRTQDLHVKEIVRLLTPRELKAQLPTTDAANATVARSRERIIRILRQEDPRLLVVVGPCSIHDKKGALEYATRLNALRQEFAGRLEIVMRVYFEKPRTTIGWKGLINDPHLDGSQDIETGLKIARRLLLDITGLGLPTATEFLDPIVPQYIADLITWAAIGARTTESQTHREMASGLSMPVGLKNSTDGSLQVAIDAMGAARQPHSFLGIDQDGVTSIVRTAGNPDAHIVLR